MRFCNTPEMEPKMISTLTLLFKCFDMSDFWQCFLMIAKQIVISYWIILNCIAELCSATLGVIGTVDSRSSKTDFSSLKFGSTSTLVGNECDKANKIIFEVIQ